MRSVTIRRWTPSLICLVLGLALAVPLAAEAENWPHWRGPNHDSTSGETGLPTTWSERENVLWRHDLPGPAASSPVVWGERIFLTSTQKGEDGLWVMAIDRQGREVWKTRADAGTIEVFEQFAHETNAASSSPAVDGERVYALFATGGLQSFDAATGKALWKADLAERYGAPNMFFGLSTSPLLVGDRLFLHLLHTDAQLVIGLDAASGRELWKHRRSTDATGECLHSYTSVLPFASSGGEAIESLLVHGADYLSAHSPEDGRELWRYGTLNPKDNYNSFFRLVASPVSRDGLVIAPTAKRGPVFGLRPGQAPEGGPQPVALEWQLGAGTPDVPSPILSGGLVYLAGENGRLTALDAKTGERVYAERVHQGPHRGSPVLADGKLFTIAVDGTVSVIQAGREFKVLAKNRIEGAGRLASSPAISRQTIYLRTADALFAIAESEKPAAEGLTLKVDDKAP